MSGVSRLVLVASKEFPRYSEGDIIELSDGRLLLAVGRKEDSSDFAKGSLIGMFSSDRGASWDDQPHVILEAFDDAWGLMSVSLCRSPRGIHLIFLARGPDPKSDTRVYQIVSTDEAKTWSKPRQISTRRGCHIVNNARVIRTRNGRLIVPVAFCDDIGKHHDDQFDFCLYSDDDGVSWKHSSELAIVGPLMEPGVAECADGSLYMTIRTKLGFLYESRSHDDGATWTNPPTPTKLPSPVAPSTVARDPTSNDLWMIWINREGGNNVTWKQRTPLSLAISQDHGATWGAPRDIESDPKHGYGYVSVDLVKDHVLLTYYDWPDEGQKNFVNTSLRQRTIPLAWFHGQIVPPVFRSDPQPLLSDRDKIISANSGLLIDKDRWRLWYTQGTLSPAGEKLVVRYAESRDPGRTWKPADGVVIADAYHPSAHRDGNEIILYAWHSDGKVNGLFRYVSADDGETFTADPDAPLLKWGQSNDAFDMIRNDRGTWEYFAACLEKAIDPRTVIAHDNCAGSLRLIGRAASADGVSLSEIDILIRPDYDAGDPYDTQFYGMQVFRHRGFYLGLLHTYHAQSQVIQPEWAWSHDGQSWARTRVKCISLGDEGTFDSRMIVFGSVTLTDDELIWLYSGANWRHNAFMHGKVTTSIGRASLPRKELEAWLDSLPQP